MSNSPLVAYTKLSPNCSKPRNHVIDTLTIHCMACNASVERCGEIFAPVSRQASSNYGIGSDGRIGLYCEEANRSWCTSSSLNDNRAVTIEVANDGGDPDWHVSDKALAALIDLCADICKRNNIKALLWKNDKSLMGHVDQQNMTLHRWLAPKSCPGPYLISKHPYIVAEVNKRLVGEVDPSRGDASRPTTPPPAPIPTPVIPPLKRNLSNGDSGADVKAMQHQLNVKGANPKLVEDGQFGNKTKDALVAFQKSHGLVADGVYGIKSNAALYA